MADSDELARIIPDDSGVDLVNDAFRKVNLKCLEDDFKVTVRRLVKRHGVVKYYGSVLNVKEGSSAHDTLKLVEAEKDKQEFGTKLTAQETYGIFLTVSPKPDQTDAFNLFKVAEKTFRKLHAGHSCYVWCIEQNGGLDDKHPIGYHPHLHAVIVLDKGGGKQGAEPRKASNWLIERFKAFNNCNASIQTQWLSKKMIADKCDYVMGKKRDDRKLDLVEVDKSWRKDNGWEDFYVLDDLVVD